MNATRRYKKSLSLRDKHKRRNNIKNDKSKKFLFLLSIFVFLLFGTLAFIFFKVLTLDKFIYLNKTDDKLTEIIIVDSKKDKIIKYLVDPESELDSARGYGSYSLNNLWTLSEKSDIGNDLVAETIIKNYYLPVYLWKNGNKSNLSIYQKVKALFINNKIIKYSDTIKSNDIKNSILINFVDEEFIDNNPTIVVHDLTGSFDTLAIISKIIEGVGGKIALNSKGYDKEFDCEVKGKNKYIDIIGNILNCSKNYLEDTDIDVEIKLGVKFAERF